MQSPPFSACFYMLLLALWCCCPSSVYRDHYVSTKADERETHRDHKRRQASLSDPLIIADSFINMAFTRRSSIHGTWKERMIDRHTHRTHRTHTHISESDPRARKITLDLGNSMCDKIISIYSPLLPDYISFARQLALKTLSPTFWRPVVEKLVTKHRHFKSCKLSHTPTPPPPLLFSFCLQLVENSNAFLTSFVWSISHQPTSSLSPPVFSFFHWHAAWTLAVVGWLSCSFEWEVKMQM